MNLSASLMAPKASPIVNVHDVLLCFFFNAIKNSLTKSVSVGFKIVNSAYY